MLFSNSTESSRDLAIFIMTFNFRYTNVDPRLLTSAAETAAVNPNGISTLFANGLRTFFNNGKSTFSNGPKSQPRNPLNSMILNI